MEKFMKKLRFKHQLGKLMFGFPFKISVDKTKKFIKNLKEVKVFKNVGHGIETYDKAMNFIGEKIKERKS